MCHGGVGDARSKLNMKRVGRHTPQAPESHVDGNINTLRVNRLCPLLAFKCAEAIVTKTEPYRAPREVKSSHLIHLIYRRWKKTLEKSLSHESEKWNRTYLIAIHSDHLKVATEKRRKRHAPVDCFRRMKALTERRGAESSGHYAISAWCIAARWASIDYSITAGANEIIRYAGYLFHLCTEDKLAWWNLR